MKKAKKAISLFLAGVMVFLTCAPAFAASNVLTLVSSEQITAGAVLKNYTWDISDGRVKAAVLEIDLTNPYVQLEVVPGKGQFTQKATVSQMANRTDAVAMVNGDFFNMKAEGAPIGTTVIDGELVSSQSYVTDVYCLGVTKGRKAYVEPFTFEGNVVAQNGQSRSLSGLNKTFYWEETTKLHSHIGKLHLYNDMWGGKKRGMDSYVGVPAEVMVKDNKVTAVAFNGGFNSSVPKDCYIIHGDGGAADYLKQNFHVGDRVQINYDYTPDKDWDMVLGGHALLVDNGKTVPYTKDVNVLGGVRARTAAGVSKDGNKVYIIAVEGRTNESRGITLGNLSLLMTKLGIWKGLNLDGGGSTTMVSRPLGETEREKVIYPEKKGAERNVVVGLGVFSSAPKGQVKGIEVSGPKTMMIGDSGTYSYKAYDEYYNPVTDMSQIKLSDPSGLGVVNGNTFTAKRGGTANLTAAAGTARVTYPVKVIGKNDVQNIKITKDLNPVVNGSQHQFKAQIYLKDGTVKTPNPGAIQWTAEGFDGTITQNGLLTVNQAGSVKDGYITASYDGFKQTYKIHFPQPGEVILTIDSKAMVKDGTVRQMDVSPTITNSRTILPIRFIAEALNGKVDWSDQTRTAYISYEGRNVEIKIGSNIMKVNGQDVKIDTPARIINGRTMIPLRAVAEGMGLRVDFDDPSRTVVISKQ